MTEGRGEGWGEGQKERGEGVKRQGRRRMERKREKLTMGGIENKSMRIGFNIWIQMWEIK